ncbi:MAG: hypothetical protein ACNYNY_06570 [Candidatus Oxydemutatoraceae bacterium WSBS_2016_MAG_OTU14]
MNITIDILDEKLSALSTNFDQKLSSLSTDFDQKLSALRKVMGW